MRTILGMTVALMVGLAGCQGPQTTEPHQDKEWWWVVTVFSGDKPTQYRGTVFGDESDCLAAGREEGDKHRDEGTVGIMCLDPLYFGLEKA